MVARVTLGDQANATGAAIAADDQAPAGAGLDDLAREAAHLDAGGAPGQAAAVPAGPDPGELVRAEAAAAVEVIFSFVAPVASLWPIGAKLASCYGKPERAALADALGDYCQARGVSMGDLFGRYGPELQLGAALLGPAVPVLLELARDRKAAADKPTAAPAPDAHPFGPPPPGAMPAEPVPA